MQEHGKVVRQDGEFRVVEVLERYLDDSTEVIGYHVLGPGADRTWLYSEPDAFVAVDNLLKLR
jgi:hypothetical protein